MVVHTSDRAAIIVAGGVGYSVAMTSKMLASLSKKHGTVKVFVFSRMNPREGTFEYYGFSSPQEYDLFKILTSVSGLGPKTALGVLDSVEPRHLQEAVANGDAQALRTISGIGIKTAQRLIVELADKLDNISFGKDGSNARFDIHSQAIEALISLGYSQVQAKEALRGINSSDLGDLVRKALQNLAS